MESKLKSRVSSISILIGIGFMISGIYSLGRHHGMEAIRKHDSGLGGLAEWVGSWILMLIGVTIVIIGTLIRKRNKPN